MAAIVVVPVRAVAGCNAGTGSNFAVFAKLRAFIRFVLYEMSLGAICAAPT
jgi:hypothetical protein